MNPDWLRYFIALAETKSFHAAADRLHVTPQAISRAIALLEDQLQLPLVDRDHRVKGLTGPGEALLEEARRVVTSHENAERRMAEWRTAEPQGPITIAGSGLWHYYLLPTILADLLAAFPRLLPRLYSMLPAEVEERVAEGAVDVGLLLAPPQRPDLEALAGLETPYRIVGSPGSPSSWRECGFVVPRFFRREGATSLDGWPDHQYPRRVVAEAEMLESMVRLCEAGVGVAFLPELAVRDRIQRGSLVVIARAPVRHHDRLFVVRRKGVRPTPAIRVVSERLAGFSG